MVDGQSLNQTARGKFLKLTPDEAFELLENITDDNCRAHETQRTAGIYDVDERTAQAARQVVDTKQITQEILQALQPYLLGTSTNVEVKRVCNSCDEDCPTEYCMNCTTKEYVHWVSIPQRQPFNQNTYHPGIRNHPNLSHGNTSNIANPPPKSTPTSSSTPKSTSKSTPSNLERTFHELYQGAMRDYEKPSHHQSSRKK